MKKSLALRWSFVLCTALACAACCLSFTCEKKHQSPVIARVGNSVLTLDDLYESIPPQYNDRISREQKINYVKQWIDTELLYQEALRQKINREKDVRERLEKMKKDLLSSEIISRNSFSATKTAVSEDAIKACYQEHKDSFVRETDVAKFLDVVVADLATANTVRQMVTPDNFLDLAARYSKAPVQDPRAVEFVPLPQLPPAIAAQISQTRIGGTTAPFAAEGGVHIVRVLDKQLKGTASSLDEVREDIIGSLSTEAQKRHMEDLLAKLRLKTDYEFHFDVIPATEAATPPSSTQESEE